MGRKLVRDMTVQELVEYREYMKQKKAESRSEQTKCEDGFEKNR
jgi:hypothetical protein